MSCYTLYDLVKLARSASPFYAALYNKVTDGNFMLADLPLVDKDEYWQGDPLKDVATREINNGIILRSGGSTGKPKFVAYSKEEWQFFTEINNRFLEILLKNNDKIACLYGAGGLWGGLLLVHDSFKSCTYNIVDLPIGVNESIENIVSFCQDLQANVLMGSPAKLAQIADYVKQNHIHLNITTIFYGADFLMPYQIEHIQSAFPQAKIATDGYASTDAGFLGFMDNACDPNEQRMAPEYTIIEVIDDETGLPIQEMNKEGRLFATNLTRTLMPVIRYPIGDKGCWVEPEGTPFRKFRLMGRYYGKSQMIKIGKNCDVDYNVIYDAIKNSALSKCVVMFQVIIEEINGSDQITLNVAVKNTATKNLPIDEYLTDIKNVIYEKTPNFLDEIAKKNVLSLKIVLIDPEQIEISPLAGKISRIKDTRGQQKKHQV